jgi:hypothetical protein
MDGTWTGHLFSLGSCSLAKSICRCAPYVTLQKYFSHPSLVIYFFAMQPIKPKLGNSKPFGLIIMMGQSETLSSDSQILFITLFSGVDTIPLLHRLPATANLYNCAGPKPFSEHILTFLHPIFNVQDHILSTAGDAITSPAI